MSIAVSIPSDSASIPSDSALRRTAIVAAHQVGGPLKRAFRSEMEVDTKSSVRDLVTLHDRRTEERLIELLSEAVPDCKFTGEETGCHGTGQVEWIIDPIDGTSNFVHGFPLFSVSIAAAVDGEVIAGVVYDPFNGLTFSADASGAFLQKSLNGVGEESALEQSARMSSEDRLNLLTNFPSAEILQEHPESAQQAFSTLVTTYSQVRRVASAALEICYVAAGWADAAFGIAVNPWDIGAAQLVLRRAGGRYLPFGTRDGSTWNGGECSDLHLAPGYFAVANGVEAPAARQVAAQFASGS